MTDDVRGYCPACGRSTLFLGAEGYITCSMSTCPEPDAASSVLDDREVEHIVTFGSAGFIIRHPLRERIGDRLMSCELHAWCEALDGPPVAPGRYRARDLGDRWAWEAL